MDIETIEKINVELEKNKVKTLKEMFFEKFLPNIENIDNWKIITDKEIKSLFPNEDWIIDDNSNRMVAVEIKTPNLK